MSEKTKLKIRFLVQKKQGYENLRQEIESVTNGLLISNSRYNNLKPKQKNKW